MPARHILFLRPFSVPLIPVISTVMKIHDLFKAHQLTSDQKHLLDALAVFLESDIPVFLLKGFAGTGKTFILKGVAGYLRALGREVTMMTPTGRASQILTTKTGYPSTTIHRKLYAGEMLKDKAEHEGNEYDVFKIFYGMGINFGSANGVYIVDESSMVSNVYSENEIMKFGSGYLLADLVGFIFPDPSASKRKIIFTGDNAQLPPVDMPFSPALDARYLRDKFHLKSMEFELSEVVRQEGHSKILANATMLRNAIKENRFGTLELDVSGEVEKINRNEVVDRYLSTAGNEFEDALIITYSNKTAYAYNQLIRAKLHPGMISTPVKGDRIVVVSNNYMYSKELLNGETGTLISIDSEVEIHRVKVRLPMEMPEGGMEKEVVLRFRNAVIRFTDADGEHDIVCRVIDNLLFSEKRDLSYHESVALLNDFKKRYGQRTNRETEFREMLRGDTYFNALRIKFGYALTCHKAQGGEWKHVYVNAYSSSGYNHENYFRWLYTAITRARQALCLMSIPGQADTTRLTEAANSGNMPVIGKEDKSTGPIISAAENGIQNLKILLEAHLKSALEEGGFEAGEIRAIEWGVQFMVNNSAGSALVRIFCSSRKPVANLDVLNVRNIDTNQLLPLFGFLNLPADKMKIISNSPDDNQPAYGNQDLSLDILQRLKNEIEKIMASAEIEITKIESNLYHEIYYFAKQSAVAVIKFHYNKKQQFTRFEIIHNKSNGLEEQIKPLLNQLKL